MVGVYGGQNLWRRQRVDDVPIFHNRLTTFILATSFVAATTILTIGLIKVWGYQHQNSQVAHGLLTVIA